MKLHAGIATGNGQVVTCHREETMPNCRSCDAEIIWEETDKGGWHPKNLDGTSHFETCPNADQHRGKGRASGGSSTAIAALETKIEDVLGRISKAAAMYTALAVRVTDLETRLKGKGTDGDGSTQSPTGSGTASGSDD